MAYRARKHESEHASIREDERMGSANGLRIRVVDKVARLGVGLLVCFAHCFYKYCCAADL
jgi:hypothetical protein